MTVTVTLRVESQGREKNSCNPTRDVWEHYNYVKYSGSADSNERSENE